MEPKATLWPLEPHTRGKHLVLRRYLEAWLPIMGSWNGRILFVDGFAGPGRYAGGEDGSPLIALDVLKAHRALGAITADIRFLLIEKNADRRAHLEQVLKDIGPTLPSNCGVRVIEGVFDETMTAALDYLEAQQKQLAPCLVMIDPFGVSGTPMNVVRRILQNKRSEVYVSFMYESINRFKDTPEFAPHLDRLFGTPDWRKGVGIAGGQDRKEFFYGLYKDQLRAAGASHVVHFDLFEGNRLVYGIFFGTQSLIGCDRMKQAIWKVAPWGDFEFHGSHAAQPTLGLENPDLTPLRNAVLSEFRSGGWVTIESVQEFVMSDRTDYHSAHLKRGVLVLLEASGEMEVDNTTRRRKRTYPAGVRLRFL